MAERRHRRIRRNLIFAPLSFLLILGAMFLGMSVFFRVTNVEIEGAGFYTVEEIVEASGVEEGDNLFFVNRLSVSGKIKARLPYVEDVSVERHLPNRVVIHVSESRAMAVLETGGAFWQLDKSCKVLGEITSVEAAQLIKITGITVDDPVVGSVVTGSDVDRQKIAYLAELLRAVEEREMTTEITGINFENVADPVFDYQGRFNVKMGKNDNVAYKLDMLLSAVAQLAPGDTGTIDLSEEQKAHFSPN